MGGSCIVPDCKSTNNNAIKTAVQIAFEKTIKISFHKFPSDSVRRAEWIKILKLENRPISKRSVICSLHFKEEFIDRTSLVCTRLRENAIPHVFENTPHFELTDKSFSNEEESLFLNVTENVIYPEHNIIQDLLLEKTTTPTKSLNINIKQQQNDRQMNIEEDSGQISIDNQVFIIQNDSEQIHIIQSTCDRETNTSPSLLLHETHDKATRVSPERIWNSPTKNEIRRIANIKITNLRKKIRSLKEIIRQKKKIIINMESIVDELRNEKLINRNQFGSLHVLGNISTSKLQELNTQTNVSSFK